ncbi:uncharacterized protein V6R79_000120 [Siganus canaliculatus]
MMKSKREPKKKQKTKPKKQQTSKKEPQMPKTEKQFSFVETHLICSQQPITALDGDDVILPCHLQPPVSAADWTVEWSKPGLDPESVHYYENGRPQFDKQNPSYSFRTELFVDDMKTGNVSVKIFDVVKSDSGIYKCFLPSIKKEASIELIVVERRLIGSQQPITALFGDDVILPCHLKPPVSAADWTVEWSKPGLVPESVHYHEEGGLRVQEQNPSFSDRTSLSVDDMKTGDVSLRIFNVKKNDSGIYKCFLPSIKKEASIKLIVAEARARLMDKVKNAKVRFENAKVRFENAKVRFENANVRLTNVKVRFTNVKVRFTNAENRANKVEAEARAREEALVRAKKALDEVTDATKKATDLESRVTDLRERATYLKNQATDAENRATDLENIAADLENGATDTADRARDLGNIATDLENRATDLENGATDLENGATDLENGATDLENGATGLENGATGLENGLTELETSAKA